MANARGNGKTLDSYTVKAIKKSIRTGDCVFMRPSDPSNPPFIAKVDNIISDEKGNNVQVHIHWYYRPEDVIGGKQAFHGTREVFISDHHDIQCVDTIEGKCKVHTLDSYTNLEAVGDDEFFCRFKYYASTGKFHPDTVDVFCKCEMPYNPDNLMVECDSCSNWFHPACVHITDDEGKRMDHFFCESCSSQQQRLLQNSRANPRHATIKAGTKRRRR